QAENGIYICTDTRDIDACAQTQRRRFRLYSRFRMYEDVLSGCDVWAGRVALSQAYCEAPDSTWVMRTGKEEAMITIRQAHERGKTQTPWLARHHTIHFTRI